MKWWGFFIYLGVMKTKQIFLILLFALHPVLQARDNCQVRLAEIAGQYIGECKDGLAHGRGISIGKDTYEGDFVAGLPHGEGTYTWADGSIYEGSWRNGLQHGNGTFSQIIDGEKLSYKGTWRNGELRRKITPPPYSVGHVFNADRYTIRKRGEGNMVLLMLYESGRRSSQYRNLLFNVSSGATTTQADAIGYEMVDFPAEVLITYTVPDKLQQGLEVRVRFEARFTEPGIWEIRIYN